MADKIVVLNAGRVEQIGSPLELYDHPSNLFVAGFIGSPAMNILPAAAEADGVRVAGMIALPVSTALPAGTALLYGIRPEHIVLGEEGGVEAEITVVEPTGADTHVGLRFAGHDLTVVTKDRLAVGPGDQVTVSLCSDRGHLFDAATGQRIIAQAG